MFFCDCVSSFAHTFFDTAPEGLLDDFWAEKKEKGNSPRGGGHAFGSLIAVFGGGQPFLQKVPSETRPGGHVDDF